MTGPVMDRACGAVYFYCARLLEMICKTGEDFLRVGVVRFLGCQRRGLGRLAAVS